MSVSSQPKKPASTFCLLSSLRVESQAKGTPYFQIIILNVCNTDDELCMLCEPKIQVQIIQIHSSGHTLLSQISIMEMGNCLFS